MSSSPESGRGIADTGYATETRKLIQLITELRGLGAQAEIDLPRIAVIGNQSAGKSSLVEALSGITVPRSSGTCTRCPMECRLQYSEAPWKCQISLRFEVDDQQKRKSEVKEIRFGPMLHDKSKLEAVLRRAQLAILNPGVAPEQFIDLDLTNLDTKVPPLDSRMQLQFSSNVVCLDLSGNDVIDLSFIDLPGIISNVAEGENRDNIDLVKSLVMRHIEGESCLILLTLTMRDDIENQSAAFLAKQVDPEGRRTIGVLTKPDTLQEGEHSAWLDVLENRRHRLTHGYYLTKQPSPIELAENLTFEQARTREHEFFARTSPWNNCRSATQDRVGIPNLTKSLSRLLSQLIRKTLPKLRREANEKRMATHASLDKLPPRMPDNPLAEMLKIITSFSTDFARSIEGNTGSTQLLQQCRPAYKAFKADIKSTAPDFRPFVSPEEEEEASRPASVEFYEKSPDHIRSSAAEKKAGSVSDASEQSDEVNTTPIYLSDVRDQIERCLTRELPFNVPYSAKIALIQQIFVHWEQAALRCFEAICQPTRERLAELLEDRFGIFTHSPLRELVTTVIDGEVERSRELTISRINWILELENPPFTLNSHYFSSCRDKWLGEYKSERKQFAGIDQQKLTEGIKMLRSAGLDITQQSALGKLTEDPWEEELIVMAEVRSYFQVTYKRIIDHLPRAIDHDFLRSLAAAVQGALIEHLELGGENSSERARGYLAENPVVVEQRADLEGRSKRLQSILEKLFTSQV